MISARNHGKRNSSAWFDVVEACKGNGCPMCTLLTKVVHGYFTHLLYEDVNDVAVRSQLRESSGFCRDHAFVLIDSGNPLGVAIIYQDILNNTYAQLSHGQTESLGPGPDCPACIYRNQFEVSYLDVLAEYPRNAELSRALRESEGLCLHHLKQLTDRIHNDELKNDLLQVHERKLGVFRRNLAEFVRKQDIQFKNETVSPEEKAACERAIDFLVGKVD